MTARKIATHFIFDFDPLGAVTFVKPTEDSWCLGRSTTLTLFTNNDRNSKPADVHVGSLDISFMVCHFRGKSGGLGVRRIVDVAHKPGTWLSLLAFKYVPPERNVIRGAYEPDDST